MAGLFYLMQDGINLFEFGLLLHKKSRFDF